jgi:hypothetical protein
MMFGSKERRRLMRNRSIESVGSEQPGVPPSVGATAASSSSSVSPSKQKQQQKQKEKQKEKQQNHLPKNTSRKPPLQPPPPAAAAAGVHHADPPVLARRSTLHRTMASLSAYRATPITKHYALNNQILAAFDSHYENQLFPVAYAIGLQFVETALLEIPKHGYYYSTRHCQERKANGSNALRVAKLLQTMLQQQQLLLQSTRSDLGNLDWQQESNKVRKLLTLALEQVSEEKEQESSSSTTPPHYIDQYEAHRAALEAELNELKRQEAPQTFLGETCGPLLDCSFTETMCPPGGLAALLPGGSSSSETLHYGILEQQQPLVPRDIPPPPPLPLQERQRTVSTIMREMMQQPPRQQQQPQPQNHNNTASTSVATLPIPLSPGIQIAEPIGIIHRPPSLHPTVSAVTRATIPPPPMLDTGSSWMARPDFRRQMSGRTYADHVALERALYLSGLEVQPELILGSDDNMMTIDPYHHPQAAVIVVEDHDDDDEQWMLERALKESEREMEALREQEELQILQACQQSEDQIYQQNLQPTTSYNSSCTATTQPPQLQRRITKSRLEIETLHIIYHEDFLHLWNSGRVRVTHVETYQGKNPGSTNGCTVIAPLLCIHHFINFTEPGINGELTDDPGLPDETIKSVIDEEVPSILPKVREELGVVQDAFLIPSDSHDYLLKNQLLSQDQFVTVIGGNILDERHLNELIRTLVEGCVPVDTTAISEKEDASTTTNGESGPFSHPKSNASSNDSTASSETNGPYNASSASHVNNPKKRDLRKAKIACTLFFHEHVVSILKLRRAHNGAAWFDIIDSLPSKQMLSKQVGRVSSENNPTDAPAGGAATHGADDQSIQVDEFGIPLSETYEVPMNTARIRCLDEEALSVALRWYACAKFNSENLNYIDAYPWEDHSTDFDPRVFQAFVWAEAA